MGTRLVDLEPGRAVLELDVRDQLRQQHAFLHGGAISYLADNALTFAGGSVLGPAVLTAGMCLDYLRPVQEGTLPAEAHVLSHTTRSAVCRVDLTCAGTVRAAAQGVVRRAPS